MAQPKLFSTMSFILQLTEEQAHALFRMPEEIAGLKALIQEVTDQNRMLKLGIQHFTKDEVCGLLRVCENTLLKWARAGKLVPVAVGSVRLYSGADIMEFSRTYKLGVTPQKLEDSLPKKDRNNRRIDRSQS
jgi:hypothetical protein